MNLLFFCAVWGAPYCELFHKVNYLNGVSVYEKLTDVCGILNLFGFV